MLILLSSIAVMSGISSPLPVIAPGWGTNIDGEWKVTKCVDDGELSPIVMTLVFANGTLNAGTKYRTFNRHHATGIEFVVGIAGRRGILVRDAGQVENVSGEIVLRGLMLVVGDEMILCIPKVVMEDFPKDFSCSPGSKRYLMTLRRVDKR